MTGGGGNPRRPRSAGRLLGPGHTPPPKTGCPLKALVLVAVPTLAALNGWAAGVAVGWWS